MDRSAIPSVRVVVSVDGDAGDVPIDELLAAPPLGAVDVAADHLAAEVDLSGEVGRVSDARAQGLARSLGAWALRPAGTEGYRTAEVTLGGVDCRALNARDMQARTVPGLYFIGEVVDVTGWLGGYNFQWAWASAHAAARGIAAEAALSP